MSPIPKPIPVVPLQAPKTKSGPIRKRKTIKPAGNSCSTRLLFISE